MFTLSERADTSCTQSFPGHERDDIASTCSKKGKAFRCRMSAADRETAHRKLARKFPKAALPDLDASGEMIQIARTTDVPAEWILADDETDKSQKQLCWLLAQAPSFAEAKADDETDKRRLT